MSEIPYLASHLEKRAGKEESFNIIKKSIKGESLTDHDWAILYSYFMPPKPKKITNPFEWVSMICDQKESYSFCKYVLVENGKTIAANTKIAHVLFDDLGLSDSWYDIKKGNAGDDVAIMPNVDQYLTHDYDSSFDVGSLSNKSLHIVDTPTGLAYVLPWNGKGVDKIYFDTMIKSINNISIKYSSCDHFVVNGTINGIKCCSIIMPFKVHGLDVSNEDSTVSDGDQKKDSQLSFFNL